MATPAAPSPAPAAAKPSNSLGQKMVVAAVGGMAAATVCHPLDTLRVQMQVRCEMHALKALRGAYGMLVVF